MKGSTPLPVFGKTLYRLLQRGVVLKKLIHSEIIENVDHKNLNVDVDFLQSVIPTAENIAIKFWEKLVSKIKNGRLHELKLYESERNYVVYRGNSSERTD